MFGSSTIRSSRSAWRPPPRPVLSNQWVVSRSRRRHGVSQGGLADAPYAKNALDLATNAYSDGSSFGASFAALFRSLLDRYGLILIDPMHSGIRRVAAPVFAKAIEQNPELDAALVERSRALEAAGYHAQVQVSDRNGTGVSHR